LALITLGCVVQLHGLELSVAQRREPTNSGGFVAKLPYTGGVVHQPRRFFIKMTKITEISKIEPEAKPEINLASLHDHFPDTRIRDCAKRLNVIVDAWLAGVGDLEGVPYLLVDAINATERLRAYLMEWGQAWRVLSQDSPQASQSSRHP
jgi:hypothetical protein